MAEPGDELPARRLDPSTGEVREDEGAEPGTPPALARKRDAGATRGEIGAGDSDRRPDV